MQTAPGNESAATLYPIMIQISRTSARSSFRKYIFRVGFWVVCTSSLGYAMKVTGLLGNSPAVGQMPEDQQMKLKNGEDESVPWNPDSTSLVSIEKLVSDYYGKSPEGPIVTIGGYNTETATFQPAEPVAAYSPQIESPVYAVPNDTLSASEKALASFHSMDPHDSYVQASLFGYLPQSGVDLTAETFRLGLVTVAIPEPASGMLMGCSLACFGFVRRRRTPQRIR